MKVSRRNFLKSILLGVHGLAIPNQVLAWGAFHEFAATHQMIVRKAHSLLRNDPAKMINPFPNLDDILSWDYAITPTTGRGPDVDGNSDYSEHYYNPIRKQGDGPKSTKKHFTLMKQWNHYRPNSESAAKNTARAAHYIADMHVPFHVLGFPAKEAFTRLQEGRWKLDDEYYGLLKMYSQIKIIIPAEGWGRNRDFEKAIRYFCEHYPDPNGFVNWFDPWYNNGYTDTIIRGITGSHQVWEALVHRWWSQEGLHRNVNRFLDRGPDWNPLWNNIPISLGKDSIVQKMGERVEKFAHDCASETRINLEHIYKKPQDGIAFSILAVKTLFRASMTTLDIGHEYRRTKDGKYKISCRVTNKADEQVTHVKARCTLKNLENQGITKSIDSIIPKQSGHQTWTLKLPPGKKADIKLEVVGFYEKTPDYGYNSREFTVKGERIEIKPKKIKYYGSVSKEFEAFMKRTITDVFKTGNYRLMDYEFFSDNMSMIISPDAEEVHIKPVKFKLRTKFAEKSSKKYATGTITETFTFSTAHVGLEGKINGEWKARLSANVHILGIGHAEHDLGQGKLLAIPDKRYDEYTVYLTDDLNKPTYFLKRQR